MKRTELAWHLAVWGMATVMALIFTRTTRIGPAVHLWGNHGIHVGDAAAFVLAYSVAAVLTVRHRSEG